jgi:hypothetical protein
MAPLKRKARWSETAGWHTLIYDAYDAPDVPLEWVESNLSGPWSSRTLTRAQYEREFRRPDDARFVLRFAFKDEADYHKFHANFTPPAGRASRRCLRPSLTAVLPRLAELRAQREMLIARWLEWLNSTGPGRLEVLREIEADRAAIHQKTHQVWSAVTRLQAKEAR